MSVNTEISRIETAKADIKAAIEGKGVTVPDTTKIDGMAALISSIEAGSGEKGYSVKTGSFSVGTMVASPNTIAGTVTGMSFTPKIVIIQKSASISVSNTSQYIFCFGTIKENDATECWYLQRESSASHAKKSTSKNIFNISKTENGFTFGRGTTTGGQYVIQTGTYNYIAIG